MPDGTLFFLFFIFEGVGGRGDDEVLFACVCVMGGRRGKVLFARALCACHVSKTTRLL